MAGRESSGRGYPRDARMTCLGDHWSMTTGVQIDAQFERLAAGEVPPMLQMHRALGAGEAATQPTRPAAEPPRRRSERPGRTHGGGHNERAAESMCESPWTTLPRGFYAPHPTEVAPAMLNKLLVGADGRAGRIMETEAYCGREDPAAHTFRGPTRRNATMFGPPGHMYVYFTYGMHWCCNSVCGPAGQGWGVLIRAIEPVEGLDLMRAARPASTNAANLANGSAKLTQALGITGVFDGADLVRNDRGVCIQDDGMRPPRKPSTGPRVGISRGREFNWRWRIC